MSPAKMQNSCTKLLAIFVALCFFVGCDLVEKKDFNTATAYAEKKEFRQALVYYDRVIQRNQETEISLFAAREGARISLLDLKDFKKAAEYYQLIVLYSKDPAERLLAQKQIATIYFDQLTDYSRAVVEINKLLGMSLDPTEASKYKMNLARAYYYQNNFFQAESEANEFLKKSTNDDDRFQMLVLKGNIFLAKKDIQKASEIFHEILKKYPDRAVKENVAITLAVAYEEMKDFNSAISVLEAMRPHHPQPDYIDIRIKRLLERQKNQPNAKRGKK